MNAPSRTSATPSSAETASALVGEDKLAVVVRETMEVTPLIRRITFASLDGSPLPRFSGGSHVIVEMQDGHMLRRNPYSLMSDPADTGVYSISVRRDDAGRGGSLFMHRNVMKGMEMVISKPVNMFPVERRGRTHLFLAGGIGITPFMSQMPELDRDGIPFELHYGIRNRTDGAYADALEKRYGKRVHIYCSDEGNKLPLERILAGRPLGTHLYVCGPQPMIQWVLDTASETGWPRQNTHYEEFLAPQSGEPYSVELTDSGITVNVGEHESLLEAIEAAGVDAPYLCRGGVCGQCLTKVAACEGEILHHDHFLSEEEKASGKKIMPCVSRFSGRRLAIVR